MKAGAKAEIEVEPFDFSDYPEDFAERVILFIETYCTIPTGVGAGELVVLAEFQREIIRGVFAPGIRQALVSMPRSNAKTTLAAMIALAVLHLVEDGPEVLVVASDFRQASITLRMARRMTELNDELLARTHIYKDSLRTPQNDGLLQPLPADPAALHGWNGALIVVDELHVVTESTFEAISSAAGKRPTSTTLAISTPSTSVESVMWRLVQHGRKGDDPSFYLKEFSAPEGCALDDVDAWRIANPAMNCEPPFLAEDGMRAAMRTLREGPFRQLRLGQWVGAVDRWLPWGRWEQLAAEPRKLKKSDRVVLAFDGSASGDSTALVGCTVGLNPFVFLVALWENPGDPRWRVPREEVTQTIADCFAAWSVVELSCDPWGWRSELESWSKKFGVRKVLEWNTALASRMAPATDRFYGAVVEGRLAHDGNERMAEHLGNAVAKSTVQGDLIAKDKRTSKKKIDAAVAAIVALDRAAFHTNKKSTTARSFAS